MRLKNIQYYIWVCSLIFGSAGFFTVIVVGEVKQLFSIDSNYLRDVYIFTYVAFSSFGLLFYIPRLRNVWLGDMMDKKYTSLWSSWIGISVGAGTGTIIFMPQVKEIELLNGMPNLLVTAVTFLVFAVIMVFLSFYAGPSRRGR